MTLIIIVVIIIAFVWGMIFKKQIMEKINIFQGTTLKKATYVSPFSEFSHEQVMEAIKDQDNLLKSTDYLAILQRNHYDEVSALLTRRWHMGYGFDNILQEQLAKCSEKILLMTFDSFPNSCQKMQHLQLMILLSKNDIIISGMLEKIDVKSSDLQTHIVDLGYRIFCKFLEQAKRREIDIQKEFCISLIKSQDVVKIRKFISEFSLGNVDADFVELVNQGILSNDDLMIYLRRNSEKLSRLAVLKIYDRCRILEIEMIGWSCTPYDFLLKLETNKLMFLLKNRLIGIPENFHRTLIERNQHEEIMFLINTHMKLEDEAEAALIERGNDIEIEAYKVQGRELCFVAKGLEELRLSKKNLS